jgi:hypothetical protein
MFALYLLATLTNIAAGPRMQSEIVLNRLGRDQYMFLVQSKDLARTLRLAHRHLPPADFDLTKRITRTKSAREAFECNRRFWDNRSHSERNPQAG